MRGGTDGCGEGCRDVSIKVRMSKLRSLYDCCDGLFNPMKNTSDSRRAKHTYCVPVVSSHPNLLISR